jgi:transcriptional regulator with XRE-family HTH domain
MTTVDPGLSGTDDPGDPPVGLPRKVFHRLATVRREKRLSEKEVAERLHVDVEVVRRQEQETSDLTLSTLYRWQQLLRVPLAELLIEEGVPLGIPSQTSDPSLMALATMVLKILEETRQPAVRRLAHTLIDQLVELVPELRQAGALKEAGRNQLLDEQGRATGRTLPVDFFLESPE